MPIYYKKKETSNILLREITLPFTEVLKSSINNERLAYERKFYNAFVNFKKKKLLKKIWDFDDENYKIKAKIAYEEQVIFKLFYHGYGWIGSIALNSAMINTQMSQYGFSIPKKFDINTVIEVITIFTDKIFFGKKYWHPFFYEVYNTGTKFLIATSPPELLKVYKKMGWKVLEKREIGEEIRYLIYVDLEEIRKQYSLGTSINS